MKTMMKITAGTLAALFLCLVFQVSTAQNPNDHRKVVKGEQLMPPPPPPPPPPPTPDVQDDQGIPHPDLPDLTPEQMEKIRKIRLDHLKTITPLRNQVREAKARLQTILASQPVDMKAAEKTVQELTRIKADLLMAAIAHDQELRKILMPDQQVLFDARPKPFLKEREK